MNNFRNVFRASAKNFAKIPGSPIAYWVSEKMVKAFKGKVINDYGSTSKGIITGDNKRFLRLWSEVSFKNTKFNAVAYRDTEESTEKWYPCRKGGEFRSWFGNNEYVINWRGNGFEVIKRAKQEGRNCQDYLNEWKFKPSISWTSISSGYPTFRYGISDLSESAGMSLFLPEENLMFIIGFLNSKVCYELLKILSPTINFTAGAISRLPIISFNHEKIVSNIVSELISLSRSDWDEYETSWDFKVNPLVREGWQRGANGMRLEDAWEAVFKRRLDWTTRMKELEEENNRLFIEAYGLEDELTSDVEWKNVSITGNPFYRYKTDADLGAIGETEEEEALSFCASVLKKYPELEARARADAVKELLSYGLGVLMGRYSLEQEGLILASQGETYQDYLERVHGADKIHPDEDGVIPAIALEGDFFKDNLLLRMREFLAAAFGKETINDNLNFIEEALDCKIEKYLTEKLFAEHAKMYKKRPIYWLFQSPKGAFKIFAYMHRMTGATAGVIRNRYLLPYIAHLEKCFNAESAKGSNMTSAERKRVKAIEAAINDCKTYNLTLQAVADESISIDLDDGVVVNWEKYKSVLARL